MRWILGVAMILISSMAQSEPIDTISTHILDKRYLIDDRLIVTSDRCNDRSEEGVEGVYVNIFDRLLYKKIAEVRVLGCDDEYQDYIDDIYKDGRNYIATIGFRYEDRNRPEVIVIDRTTYGIKEELTMAKAVKKGYKINTPIVNFKKDLHGNTQVSVAGYRSNKYIVEHIGKGNSKKEFTHQSKWAIEKILLIDEEYAIFELRPNDSTIKEYYLTNIQTNNSKLLYRGPFFERKGNKSWLAESYSNILVINNNLIFGRGRDLYYININNYEVRVISEYQRGGFHNNGNGVDMNRIEHVMADDHTKRILIFCFEGICNSYISYSELIKIPSHTIDMAFDKAKP